MDKKFEQLDQSFRKSLNKYQQIVVDFDKNSTKWYRWSYLAFAKKDLGEDFNTLFSWDAPAYDITSKTHKKEVEEFNKINSLSSAKKYLLTIIDDYIKSEYERIARNYGSNSEYNTDVYMEDSLLKEDISKYFKKIENKIGKTK